MVGFFMLSEAVAKRHEVIFDIGDCWFKLEVLATVSYCVSYMNFNGN